MKLIETVLHIELKDFVAAGISENTVLGGKSKGLKCWNCIPDPADGRKVLVKYDDLQPKYKAQLTNHFGNPHDYVAKTPIRNFVTTDFKAEEFFHQYRFNDNASLPAEHIKRYVIAASWLNALIKAESDKKALKKALGLSIAQFWEHVKQIIEADNIELPTSQKRLREKIKEYGGTNYACLIDWRFGNQNRAKISDETSQAVLLELICNSKQHDDVIVARAYNSWAAQNGYETVTSTTVGNHRRKNYYQLQGFREGNSNWYNDFGKQVMRKRPSAPLLLVGSDDNDLDLYFAEIRERKGRNETNYYFRYKMYIVMDAYNDYPLGYAYGETISIELIKAAYLDAIHHVKELTGGWYNMAQIQTDHWALDAKMQGDLASYFKNLATFTPAAVKVSRAKYIERAFGVQWHQVLKLYPNYAGHNITSQSRINQDALQATKKDFPTKDQAPAFIEDFMNRMRLLVNPKTGKSRKDEWLNGFWASELSQERLLSESRMLCKYGTPHIVPSAQNPLFPNTITNGGLQVTLNGRELVYDIPDALYLQNVGKKVQVVFDPYDYSRVLVTDGDKLRFVAYEYEKMPSAIADYEVGDGARLNSLQEQKLRHVQQIADAKDKRRAIVERSLTDVESLLQANVMVKEVKYQTDQQYHQLTNDRQKLQPTLPNVMLTSFHNPKSPQHEHANKNTNQRPYRKVCRKLSFSKASLGPSAQRKRSHVNQRA